MLLTKGEMPIGLLDASYVKEIISALYEEFGFYETRTSLACGYVRKGLNYLALYNGRFGIGVTVRYRNCDSTRYCNKETLVFKYATAEELEEVITRTLKRYGVERRKNDR